MAILNKITVGGKLVLELDASPISSGVPAPQGSHAMFNDGGVGRSYLKVGALDTDWLAYQTGSDAPAWNFAQNASGLNDALAKSYFGTKSGNFDIEIRRNDVMVMDLRSTTINLGIGHFVKDSGEIRFTSGGNIALSANTSFSVISTAGQEYSGTYYLKSYQHSSSTRAYHKESAVGSSPADGDATNTLSVETVIAGRNRMAVVYISVIATDGTSLMMKKTVHLNQANVVELIQDDFTSKNALALGISVSIAYVGTTYQVTYSGLTGIVGKACRVKLDETVMF